MGSRSAGREVRQASRREWSRSLRRYGGDALKEGQLPLVAVVTHIPSPYQIELLDVVAGAGRIRLRVIYVERSLSERLWKERSVEHECVSLDEGGAGYRAAEEWVQDSDLAVFSWYGGNASRRLMRARASSGRRWAFWGERPGFGRLGALGRMRRRLLLRDLHAQRVPIWGIGSWAVEAWRSEFGVRRRYLNVPYHSDLSRFAPSPGRVVGAAGQRRVLYSGSLIRRKGVDLLSEAFRRVCEEYPGASLRVVGAGPLEEKMRRALSPVADRVCFEGFRDWDELPSYYQASDILCAPSRYDGWGLIVPEGLAAGMPVIGTEGMGAAHELIRHGQNGWRVPGGNVEALTQALREAIGLPEAKYQEMARAARLSVGEHTLQHGADRFAEAVFASLSGPPEASEDEGRPR